MYSYTLHLLFIHIIHTHIHTLEVSMYMVTLLIVIVSLPLVDCYSTKSEIRFGYGLLYEYRGQLLNGFAGRSGNAKIYFYSILIPTGTAFKLWTIY